MNVKQQWYTHSAADEGIIIIIRTMCMKEAQHSMHTYTSCTYMCTYVHTHTWTTHMQIVTLLSHLLTHHSHLFLVLTFVTTVLVRSSRGKWCTPVSLKTTFPYSINYKYDGVIGVALVLSMEYNFYYHQLYYYNTILFFFFILFYSFHIISLFFFFLAAYMMMNYYLYNNNNK